MELSGVAEILEDYCKRCGMACVNRDICFELQTIRKAWNAGQASRDEAHRVEIAEVKSLISEFEELNTRVTSANKAVDVVIEKIRTKITTVASELLMFKGDLCDKQIEQLRLLACALIDTRDLTCKRELTAAIEATRSESDQEIATLRKALELACIKYERKGYCKKRLTASQLVEYFTAQAKAVQG